MTLAALILLTGTLNLCLGYFLAVELGYGPPRLADTWTALAIRPGRRSGRGPGFVRSGRSSVPEPAVEDLVGQVVPTTLDDILDEPGGEAEVEPFDEPYDDDLAELLTFGAPENWDLNEKYVETSILRLNIAMMKSGARATEIDTLLRTMEGRTDLETIRLCVARLREDCETYLAEQAEAAQRFEARMGELGELRALGEEISMTNLEQAAQIETTLSNLAHMDFESDLEAANRRLRVELASLRLARHKLRDSQEAAFLAIARYENRMDKIEVQLYNDPLTGLRNRIGLETSLWHWWQQKRHQSRPMCAALFDLDHFTQINDDYGPQVGDRLLRHVAGLVQRSASTGDLAGRFAGQRFLTVVLDAGPRTASKNAEIVRQTLEKTTFHHEGKSIQLTLSSALCEAAPEDTMETLLARLEKTLAEAKQGGRNCLYDFDQHRLNSKPVRVDSPNFGAEPQEISI